MARANNPVVGTVPCEDCGETATLHQTSRGKSKALYKRCQSDACGGTCDQSTSPIRQKRWRTEMTPREGYEHLKIEPVQVPEVPDSSTEPEPAAEPVKPTAPKQTPAPSGSKMASFMPFLMGGVILLLTAGRGPMS